MKIPSLVFNNITAVGHIGLRSRRRPYWITTSSLVSTQSRSESWLITITVEGSYKSYHFHIAFRLWHHTCRNSHKHVTISPHSATVLVCITRDVWHLALVIKQASAIKTAYTQRPLLTRSSHHVNANILYLPENKWKPYWTCFKVLSFFIITQISKLVVGC